MEGRRGMVRNKACHFLWWNKFWGMATELIIITNMLTTLCGGRILGMATELIPSIGAAKAGNPQVVKDYS